MATDLPVQDSPTLHRTARYLALAFILTGLGLRLWTACNQPLWVDEAESCINGLTILETGLPGSEYLGLPLYENTLTEPWPGHAEYAFKDSSYSDKGLTVYHGWLPLYSIALAQALCGLEPDSPPDGIRPQHGEDELFLRTLAPRLPALLFSAGYLILVFQLVRGAAGSTAAIATLLWLSVGYYGIYFGHQARYYPLTLLFSAACAGAAWHLYKRGGWKDYLLLGLAEAGLFHTHQLSAVIFAITCLVLVPRILRHERWFLKCAAAASLAALLTVPWALWAGFFTTAADVPKAYELFTDYADWLSYLLDRPVPILTLLLLIGLFLLSKLRRRFRPGDRLPGDSGKDAAVVFLLTWLVVAFLAFHLVVPAASFFFERLTLIALTPFACLIGILFAEFLPKRDQAIALLPACAAALMLLYLTKDLPRAPKRFQLTEASIGQVIDYMDALPERPANRIYATPNEHLIWTYYTGVPVQSIAPIRRSFLHPFEGRILYLEHYTTYAEPDVDAIQQAARAHGAELDTATSEALVATLLEALAFEDLRSRQIRPAGASAPAIPPYLADYLDSLQANSQSLQARKLNHLKSLMIFKNLPMGHIPDLWMAFFYRFVDPVSRTGTDSNIRPIQNSSKLTLLPRSGVIIYLRDSLADSTKDG